MHAEEGKRGIGHRVDEVSHEGASRGDERVVLAPERHDGDARIDAAAARDAIGLEPGAVDEHAAHRLAARGLEQDAVR